MCIGCSLHARGEVAVLRAPYDVKSVTYHVNVHITSAKFLECQFRTPIRICQCPDPGHWTCSGSSVGDDGTF